MKRLRVTLILLAAVLASGCIDVDTLIRVNADGSGTVRERVLVSRTLTEPLRAMTEGLGRLQGEGKAVEPFSVLRPERLAQRAARMGEGVRLVSADPVEDEDAEGYVARYRFADVSALRINQNPGDRAPGGAAGETVAGGKEFLTFDFTPGNQPELRVVMPRGELDERRLEREPREALPGADGEAMLAKAREMFRGLRVAIAVEVVGEILETNASHREGDRVVLMELDFSKLLGDSERLKALSERRPRTLEEAKELLRDLPGVKVETEDEVRIRFRGDVWRLTGGMGPAA